MNKKLSAKVITSLFTLCCLYRFSSFAQSMATTGGSDFNTVKKYTPIPKVRISMENEEGYSETLIGFPDDATVGVDRSYDALKFKSQTDFNIYTFIEGNSYAIQGLPFIDGVDIALGYDLASTTDVTFSLELTDMEGNLSYYLYDESINLYYPWNPVNTLTVTPITGISQSNLHLIIHRYEIEPTVIWSEGTWSNVTGPVSTNHVLLDDDYNTTTHGNLLSADLLITKGNTLEVASGTTLDIKGNLYNDGIMNVNSGGSLMTYAVNWVKGNDIVINRNMRYSSGASSFIGIPTDTSKPIIGSELSSFIYGYDESIAFEDGTEDGLQRWIKMNNENLIPGHGYAVAATDKLVFSGTPNNGTITLSNLSLTNDATTTANNHGWHLVSNPYASAIDAALFIQANNAINTQIAIWDDPNNGGQTRGSNADYMIVNELGSVGIGPNGGDFNGAILSTQGFMVQVADGQAPAEITFNENMRISADNTDNHFFRKENQTIPTLKIIMTGKDQQYSETLIGFPSDATGGFDKRYDATKLKGKLDYNVYTWISAQAFAIQGIPMNEEVMIPIGVDVPHDAQFSLELNVDNMTSHLDYFLYNKTINSLTPWDVNVPLSLHKSSEIKPNSLFLIISSSTTLNLNDFNSKITLHLGSESMTLFSQRELKTRLQILDLSGKELFQLPNQYISKSGLVLQKPTKPGIYLMIITSSGDQSKIKFLVD